MSSDFERAVAAVIARLAPGEVVSYGEVATEAGFPGAARAVGQVLARTDGLPWWRVVTSTGRLVPGHEREHAERLRAEGVAVTGNRVRPVVPSRPPQRFRTPFDRTRSEHLFQGRTGGWRREMAMAMTTDPVCGMRIDTDDAVATTEHEGKTHYFCSEACHEAFLADPVRYAP